MDNYTVHVEGHDTFIRFTNCEYAVSQARATAAKYPGKMVDVRKNEGDEGITIYRVRLQELYNTTVY